jgi:hypothetical protein
MITRRKELPAHLVARFRAFTAVLDEIEPGKAGVADVLPGTRLPGRPLRDAVEEYRRRLGDARPLMPPWRCPDLEDEWQACSAGLDRAIDRAERLLAAPADPEGFEPLLGTVEQLLDPLEPFAAAEERFRRLRRRAPRNSLVPLMKRP